MGLEKRSADLGKSRECQHCLAEAVGLEKSEATGEILEKDCLLMHWLLSKMLTLLKLVVSLTWSL